MTKTSTWNDIYAKGEQFNRYPYDTVVTFIKRNTPKDKRPSELSLLEVGCGAGNNLRFAAEQGFNIAGIDGSPHAIVAAHKILSTYPCDLHIGDFSSLPFENDNFDFVIDRAAVTTVKLDKAKQTINEINRVLKPGGLFYSELYATNSTPGVFTLEELSYLYNQETILDLFKDFKIITMTLSTDVIMNNQSSAIRAYWKVTAQKPLR